MFEDFKLTFIFLNTGPLARVDYTSAEETTIYINEIEFHRMPEHHRAWLISHEALHAYFHTHKQQED